jgi:hypothetical protein
MITFLETSLSNAMDIAAAGYAATQAVPRTAAIDTALNYLFDPTVNGNAGMLYGSSMLLPIPGPYSRE